MSMRLQVLLERSELERFRRLARKRGMTLSAWVRRTLEDAARQEPRGDVARKLAALKAAARHSFPAPAIDGMLREIERGYEEGGG